MNQRAKLQRLRGCFRDLGFCLRLVLLALVPTASRAAPGTPTAQTYNQLGLDCLNRNDYDHAITNFTAAIRLNPRDAYAYNCRGLAREDKDDFDGAISDFREAVSLAPNYANVYLNCGWLLLYKKHDPRVAMIDFNEAIRLDPTNADYYLTRGQAYACQTNFDQALADFNRAAELQPTSPKIYLARAQFYSSQTNFARAMDDFDAAIQLQPTNAASALNDTVPDPCLMATNLDEALNYFATAIQRQPDNTGFYYLRSQFLLEVRTNYDLAAADFTECLRLQPPNARLYFDRSRAEKLAADNFARLGDQTDRNEHMNLALGDRRQAATLDPIYLDGLGQLECDFAQYEQGIADMTKYINAFPTNYSGWKWRAYAYERAAVEYAGHGEPAREKAALDSALADWSHLVSMDMSTNVRSFFLSLRGSFYARNGQYASALNDYHQTDTMSRFSLAWLLATCPDPAFRDGTKALTIARQICAEEGDAKSLDEDSLACLAAAQAETGDFTGAVETQLRAMKALDANRMENQAQKADLQERLALYKQKKPCHKLPGLYVFD